MANEIRGSGAHSAEYFGESRDYWWNDDFLDLMARRWSLAKVRTALDVGCGIGHWGRCLLSRLSDGAVINGVDPETRWVKEATRLAQERGLAARLSYGAGHAEQLPFADDAFDLVTCQTVLIHVPKPQAALAEMIRVARPGALIAVVEPNNAASALMLDSSLRGAPTQEIVALVELQLIAERGKAALGLGDNSVGEQIPTIFRSLGLDDVRVYLSDCANPILSPYEDPASRALVAEMLDWSKRDFWIWDEEETRRYFVAGGGTPEAFSGYWCTAAAVRQRQAHAVAAHQYDSAGGGLTYLVSGRKPGR